MRPFESSRVGPVARLATAIALFSSLLAPASAQSAHSKPLKIVELFTSHGCSSCPPADRLLGQLIADDPDLVALEYHVDYWNDLVYRGSNWVDPYSDPAWTERQRDYYQAALEGRRGVYTPQMVVNGRYAAVGSDVRRVSNALASDQKPSADVAIDRDGGVLSIAVRPLENHSIGAEVLLVRYRHRAMTEITAGENRHLMITNHHIVRSVESLGAVRSDGVATFTARAAEDGHGCAIIVQRRSPGPIFGASVCP